MILIMGMEVTVMAAIGKYLLAVGSSTARFVNQIYVRIVASLDLLIE